MKRSTCVGFAAAAAALGAARLIDLLLFTEAATGFSTAGSVWLRYGIAALYILAVLAALRFFAPAQPKALPVPCRPLVALTAVVSLLAGVSMLGYAVSEAVTPTTIFGIPESGPALQMFALVVRLALGTGLILYGAWFAVMYLSKKPLDGAFTLARRLGYGGVIAFVILPLLRYAEGSININRTIHVLPLFSALAALMFSVKLLGTLCVPVRERRLNSLCAAGLCAFFMCTCLELPQTLWQLCNTSVGTAKLLCSLTVGLTGLVGLAAALLASENGKAHNADFPA